MKTHESLRQNHQNELSLIHPTQTINSNICIPVQNSGSLLMKRNANQLWSNNLNMISLQTQQGNVNNTFFGNPNQINMGTTSFMPQLQTKQPDLKSFSNINLQRHMGLTLKNNSTFLYENVEIMRKIYQSPQNLEKTFGEDFGKVKKSKKINSLKINNGQKQSKNFSLDHHESFQYKDSRLQKKNFYENSNKNVSKNLQVPFGT